MNFATPFGISPAGYFVFAHLDGRHSFIDIQEAYAKQFGVVLPSEELHKFIEMLDENYYLRSDRFADYQNAAVLDFQRRATRAATHADGVYSSDAAALNKQLDGYFIAAEGPGLPRYERIAAAPKAIVAPHIDFHRGGPAYACAYKPLAESAGADLFILLGTSHCGGENPFILTRKDFETPLGLVNTDGNFVDALQERCSENLFADEYLHRGEHSLEFQVVFLKYVAKRRAELTGTPERPFKIVPILVSSFHTLVVNQTLPEHSPRIGNFLTALRELARSDQREVCFVAGVDLAHAIRRPGADHGRVSQMGQGRGCTAGGAPVRARCAGFFQ
jgi:AmmeMemoRadiSam system protein B